MVSISRIEKPRGGEVNFTVQGQGLGIVTVTWRNPIENQIREDYFVVASGVIVDSADTITLTSGQMMMIAVPRVVRANAYAGNTLLPSSAVGVVIVRVIPPTRPATF